MRNFGIDSSFMQVTCNFWVGVERAGFVATDKRAYNVAQFSRLFKGLGDNEDLVLVPQVG